MPLFAHTFEELEDLVDFKSLKLRSSYSIIIVKVSIVRHVNNYSVSQDLFLQSVYSEAADVETTNGPIYGNYTTSEYLSLRSSNGPITTNVTLINAATGHPTEVDMRTSNGWVHSCYFSVKWLKKILYLIQSYYDQSYAGFHRKRP